MECTVCQILYFVETTVVCEWVTTVYIDVDLLIMLLYKSLSCTFNYLLHRFAGVMF